MQQTKNRELWGSQTVRDGERDGQRWRHEEGLLTVFLGRSRSQAEGDVCVVIRKRRGRCGDRGVSGE